MDLCAPEDPTLLDASCITHLQNASNQQHLNKRAYYNCSVLGCHNTSYNSELSFFSIPPEGERRAVWLKLIQREDLDGRAARHCRVCEVHFDRHCVLASPNRKVLTKNSAPKFLLPAPQCCARETQTYFAEDYEPLFKADSATQTSRRLISGGRRCGGGAGRRRRRRRAEASVFLQMCDRFLSPELAALVKEQAQRALARHGKRAPTVDDQSRDSELGPLLIPCVAMAVDGGNAVTEEGDTISVKTEQVDSDTED